MITSEENAPDAGKVWRQKEKGVADDEMVGSYHWLNGHDLSKLQVTVKDREPWSAVVHGFAKGRTVLSSWTTTTTESSACRWTTFGLSIYNSTQNWHYLLRQHQIPQVKGSVLSDCLSLLPSEAISSPGCYLYFGVTGCKSEVHKTPFLCSVISL